MVVQIINGTGHSLGPIKTLKAQPQWPRQKVFFLRFEAAMKFYAASVGLNGECY